MLLPFAGFLYGSVFRIQALSRNPATARLTHFVFPVLTLGPLGPILVVVGLVLFVVGAVRIYAAKLRRTGLVTGGLYRLVRHPQYLSLTLFGLGILLTWGRAIAYISFVAMMFLYYWLARLEERKCREAFGEDYERYRSRTSFALPGDRRIGRLFAGLGRWPLWSRVALGATVTVLCCVGSMELIRTVKVAVRTVPVLTATSEGTAAPEFVLVKAPILKTRLVPAFAEEIRDRLAASTRFRAQLTASGADEGLVPLAFPRPGPGWYREHGGKPRISVFVIMVRPEEEGEPTGDLFRTDRRELVRAFTAELDLSIAPPADGVVRTARIGPARDLEERFDFFLSGV
jgi:protein-S-isoprenylcysteine O-methyltransferase Ste14